MSVAVSVSEQVGMPSPTGSVRLRGDTLRPWLDPDRTQKKKSSRSSSCSDKSSLLFCCQSCWFTCVSFTVHQIRNAQRSYVSSWSSAAARAAAHFIHNFIVLIWCTTNWCWIRFQQHSSQYQQFVFICGGFKLSTLVFPQGGLTYWVQSETSTSFSGSVQTSSTAPKN